MKMKSLKTLRCDSGMDQRLLAERSEITLLTIQNIESGRTVPHPDCRKRLEICLGSRINWLKTTGIKPCKEKKTWEEVESALRVVLQLVTALPESEFAAFFTMSKEYILTLEELMQMEYDDSRVPLSGNETIHKMCRKHVKLTRIKQANSK